MSRQPARRRADPFPSPTPQPPTRAAIKICFADHPQIGRFVDHPQIGRINLLADALAECLGPMFWAALIVLWLWAEILAY